MAPPCTVSLQIRWERLRVSLVAQTSAYSPDVVSDLVSRALVAFQGALMSLDDNGVIVDVEEPEQPPTE